MIYLQSLVSASDKSYEMPEEKCQVQMEFGIFTCPCVLQDFQLQIFSSLRLWVWLVLQGQVREMGMCCELEVGMVSKQLVKQRAGHI